MRQIMSISCPHCHVTFRELHDPAKVYICPSCGRSIYKNAQGRGLYQKYKVERLNDPLGKHKNCEYFVLDLVHDKYAVPALRAYAEVCRDEHPELAKDLLRKCDEIDSAQKEDKGLLGWAEIAVCEMKSAGNLVATPMMLVPVGTMLALKAAVQRAKKTGEGV